MRCPAPAPAFLFGGTDVAMARHLFGQIDIPAAGCFSATDSAIGPGGVVIKDSSSFHGEALGLPAAHAAAILDRLRACPTTTCVAPGTAASLFGMASDAASLLTDIMPRLWVLAAAGHDIGAVRVPIPADAHADAAPLLRAAGLADAQLLLGESTDAVLRAPRVLAPALLRHGARFSPLMGEATRFWTARLRATLGLPAPKPHRALFLSPRDTTEPTGVADWQRIEAAATDRGLATIHPAALSLADRAATYGQAACLLGFDGAALTEACVLAPAGIPVCAIRGNTASDVRLAGLAPALGHAIGFVFGVADQEDPGAPAQISGEALQSALTALFLLKDAPGGGAASALRHPEQPDQPQADRPQHNE
jgi:hypothetical protein